MPKLGDSGGKAGAQSILGRGGPKPNTWTDGKRLKGYLGKRSSDGEGAQNSSMTLALEAHGVWEIKHLYPENESKEQRGYENDCYIHSSKKEFPQEILGPNGNPYLVREGKGLNWEKNPGEKEDPQKNPKFRPLIGLLGRGALDKPKTKPRNPKKKGGPTNFKRGGGAPQKKKAPSPQKTSTKKTPQGGGGPPFGGFTQRGGAVF